MVNIEVGTIGYRYICNAMESIEVINVEEAKHTGFGGVYDVTFRSTIVGTDKSVECTVQIRGRNKCFQAMTQREPTLEAAAMAHLKTHIANQDSLRDQAHKIASDIRKADISRTKFIEDMRSLGAEMTGAQ